MLCHSVLALGCDELITRPKESCHVSNKIKKPQKGGQGPAWAVKATDDGK
jgi:hypothetical protein